MKRNACIYRFRLIPLLALILAASCTVAIEKDEEARAIRVEVLDADDAPPCDVGEWALVTRDVGPFSAGEVVECIQENGRKTVRPYYEILVVNSSNHSSAWLTEESLASLVDPNAHGGGDAVGR